MPAPTALQSLVDAFARDEDQYRSSDYKEANVRTDFINPLFTALGWDVENKHLKNVTDREVVAEKSLLVGGTKRAPDYSFSIARRTQFFVEAKKPSVAIDHDKEAAFQIRRYCWSAGLPFGVLTNFRELAVYDCRLEPAQADSASVGRVKYLKYAEYEREWEWLNEWFGRSAVAAEAITRLAQREPVGGKARPIDIAFLDEIRNWRSALAKDIAANNTHVGEAALNDTVQRLIDRIIFLRIAEARGLEPDNELGNIAKLPDIYQRLVGLFRRADSRYNSGLFHFSDDKGRAAAPDTATPRLAIGDATLRQLLSRLYYPIPYEFALLPADTLGRVYEQFLGEVITMDARRRVNVEMKLDRRKGGGIYYTPQPIVEYIVSSTLDPVLNGLSAAEASKIRVLDPACGSGSFLISAYQHLLDWHLVQYAKTPSTRKKYLETDAQGSLRVRTLERRRILLNCVFGVDIDPQAVEVAKLSLLLKVIEGQQQMELQVGRLLPDLDANIRCGNALLGKDLRGSSTAIDAGLTRHRPFDWSSSFPTVAASGGFSVVVGNPPYVNVDNVWGTKDPRLAHLKREYPNIYADKTDLLYYFLARATALGSGEIGMIVSRSFLEATKAAPLRGWLAANARVREIIDFRTAPVFPGVGINTAVIRLTHSRRPKTATVRRYRARELPSGYTSQTISDHRHFRSMDVPHLKFGKQSWNFAGGDVAPILAKVDRAGQPVGGILSVGQGMQTGANAVFEGIGLSALEGDTASARYFFVRARNSDIERYTIRESGIALLYPEDAKNLADLPPLIQSHLTSHRTRLEDRAACRRGNCEWWKYTWPLQKSHVRKKRLYCPYMASDNRFAMDDQVRFLGITDTTVLYDNGQPEDLRYVMGVLNSRLLTARFRFIGKLKGGGVYEYFENTVSQLVVPRRVDHAKQHDAIVDLVESRLHMGSELSSTTIATERDEIQGEIAILERAIDDLVYELFGINSDERDLLEGMLDAGED